MARPSLALAALLGLTLSAGLSGCSKGDPPSAEASSRSGVKAASPQKARELIDKGAAVVDVREPDETAYGVLTQAKLLPSSRLRAESAWKAELASLPKDKPVVVYCALGSRAQRVAERLSAEGYDAYNAGGYEDLKAAGLPTRKP